MAPEIKREKLCDGVYFSSITDKKFKTNLTVIRFITPLNAENVSANAIVPDVLAMSCAEYPTHADLCKKLNSLYGAYIGNQVIKTGDNRVLHMQTAFQMSTLLGKKINSDMTDILVKCIFEPATEDGVFSAKEFSIRKQSLIDEITAEINEKRSYARSKAEQAQFLRMNCWNTCTRNT